MDTITPVKGMGCTIQGHSDRHACTIIRVSESGKTFWCQRDIATRTDNNGMSESQEYTFRPDPSHGTKYEVYKTRDGKNWKVRGAGLFVLVGIRREFYDFSF